MWNELDLSKGHVAANTQDFGTKSELPVLGKFNSNIWQVDCLLIFQDAVITPAL